MTVTEKKPIWVTKNGRKMYSPKDFDDGHLLNMIPFLLRGVLELNFFLKQVDEDTSFLLKKQIDYRIELAILLMDEAGRRGLVF